MSTALADRLVERRLFLHQRLDRDILVSRTGSIDDAVFLKLAQVDVVPNTDGTADVCLPESLARERRLLP